MNRTMLFAAALGLAMATFSGAALASGDPAAGKKVYRKCAGCHSLEPGKKKIGPRLHGVVGRVPGTAEGVKFSKAMKAYGESGIVWNQEALDAFLESPRKVVKGTRMGFAGLKTAEQRADVIAYLKQAAEQ